MKHQREQDEDEKLTWNYNNYIQIFKEGRKLEDVVKAMGYYQFTTPNLPFEICFTQFCDYVANPAIVIKDEKIILEYIEHMLPQLEKSESLFKLTLKAIE